MRHPSSAKAAIASFETELREFKDKKEDAIYRAHYDAALKIRGNERAFSEQWQTAHPHGVALDAPIVIEPRHVRETIADILDIDILDTDAPMPDFADMLAHSIVGQEEAIRAVTAVVTRARAGLISPHRPIGSFLFLGPSGVGKTHTAKILADALFGKRPSYHAITNFIRVDMSEFSEPHSVSRLLGAPPGYVGHEEGGFLTEKIKRNPYALVLFDEIEKAHPQIFNILLQILDEGILTDANSETANFRNSIIILTSNIGTEEFNKKAIGFSEEKTDFNSEYKDVEKNVLTSLKSIMRPELLNRMDHILTFLPLSKKSLERIVEINLNELAEKLNKEKGIEISWDEKTLGWLAEKSISENEGARLVKRIIAEYVEFPIAEMIISGITGSKDAQKICIWINTDGLAFKNS